MNKADISKAGNWNRLLNPLRFCAWLPLTIALLTPSFNLAFAQTHSASAEDSPEKDYSSELPRLPPRSLEESLAAIQVVDGYSVQLVAAEPLLADPVAFAFDARGRLFVVEMKDYSEQETEHLGSVAILTDSDGDGVMDQRDLFVEGLSWPTAIWPWRDGVLVAEPPRITWYRDTDDDGRSDRSEDWFTGFGRGNVQGLVNSLRWGVDGFLHGATSSAGAELQSNQTGQAIPLGRRDFAIDPLNKSLYPETGGGQHGLSFNRWGDKFVTSNSDHLQQIINLEDWFGHHPSRIPIPSSRRSIAEDGPQAEVFRVSPVEPWRIVRTRLRVSGVAPGIVEGGGRAAGYFTGATGTWIMDHEMGFGDPQYDTAFVCDVGSNLVHRKNMIDQGLFWTARRIDDSTEFLRSEDTWFRPVQLGDGPDGALYIADMCREVIEHPKSLPPMIKKHLDLTSGRDRGRIWRVASKQTPTLPSTDLSQKSDLELIRLLSSGVPWQRRMASQLLIERFLDNNGLDASVIESVKHTAVESDSPEARILSQHLLNRVGLFSIDIAPRLLQDRHPRVLATAIELCGRNHLTHELIDQLSQYARSSETRVQLALTLVSTDMEIAVKQKLLTQLASNANEPILMAAIAAAFGEENWKLVQQLDSNSADKLRDWLTLLLPTWSDTAALSVEHIDWLRTQLKSDAPRLLVWLDTLAALPSQRQAANLLTATNSTESINLVVDRRIAADIDSGQPISHASSWLGLCSIETQNRWMRLLLQPTSPEPIQTSCINALAWAGNPELAGQLIAEFRSMTPTLQRIALRAITLRESSSEQLATALESEQILRSQIPPDVQQNLLRSRQPALAKRYAALLDNVVTDRAELIQTYRDKIDSIDFNMPEQTRQLELGAQTFDRVCAQCHRVGVRGQDIGPPLQSLANKSQEQILEAILDPNREVDPKYAAYTALTEDGQVIAGIIREDSGAQIVIAEAGGKTHTLPRTAIEQLSSSGVSLMPVGIEQQITPEQMGYLILYLMKSSVRP